MSLSIQSLSRNAQRWNFFNNSKIQLDKKLSLQQNIKNIACQFSVNKLSENRQITSDFLIHLLKQHSYYNIEIRSRQLIKLIFVINIDPSFGESFKKNYKKCYFPLLSKKIQKNIFTKDFQAYNYLVKPINSALKAKKSSKDKKQIPFRPITQDFAKEYEIKTIKICVISEKTLCCSFQTQIYAFQIFHFLKAAIFSLYNNKEKERKYNQDQHPLRNMWTQQEQILLKSLRDEENLKSWVVIAQRLEKKFPEKKKTPKQCRQKYVNHASFTDKNSLKQQWSASQMELLYNKYMEYGPKWNFFKSMFPNRSENGIKNKFHCSLRKFLSKVNAERKRKVSQNQILKLITIFQKPESVKEGYKQLLKYQDLRSFVLSSSILPQKILNHSEIQLFHEGIKAFNIDSKWLNPFIGKIWTSQNKQKKKLKEGKSYNSLSPINQQSGQHLQRFKQLGYANDQAQIQPLMSFDIHRKIQQSLNEEYFFQNNLAKGYIIVQGLSQEKQDSEKSYIIL